MTEMPQKNVMSDAERLAERLRELLENAEQEADDIRYYSGSNSKYTPHRDALDSAMREALPTLLARIAKLEDALWLISYTSAGSTTANSLPHICKIAQEALETQRPI